MGSRAGDTLGHRRENEDVRSDWGESQGIEQPDGRAQVFTASRKTPGQAQSRQNIQGNSTSRIVVANKPVLQSNNLMAAGNSHKSPSENTSQAAAPARGARSKVGE